MLISELVSKLNRCLELYGDIPVSIGMVGLEEAGGDEQTFLIDDFGVVACGNEQRTIEQVILAEAGDIQDGYFGETQRRLGVVK